MRKAGHAPVLDNSCLRHRTDIDGKLGCWDWDVLSDRLFLCPNGAGFFGIDRLEAASGVALDRATGVIHPDDCHRVIEAIGNASAEGGRYAQTYRVSCAKGGHRTIHAFGACVTDGRKRPIRFSGVLMDLSEASDALVTSPFDIACDHLFAAREAALQSGDQVLIALCEMALRHMAEETVSSFKLC